MIIDCDLEITRIDGDEEVTITTGQPDTEINETEAKEMLESKAEWPFPNARPPEGPKE